MPRLAEHVHRDRQGHRGRRRLPFIILGAQTPLFSGISTTQGGANGAVLLSAFGNDLVLDWEGEWSDNTFGCDHSGESTIAPIGDFSYSIRRR